MILKLVLSHRVWWIFLCFLNGNIMNERKWNATLGARYCKTPKPLNTIRKHRRSQRQISQKAKSSWVEINKLCLPTPSFPKRFQNRKLIRLVESSTVESLIRAVWNFQSPLCTKWDPPELKARIAMWDSYRRPKPYAISYHICYFFYVCENW